MSTSHGPETSNPAAPAAPPVRRKRGWIWFFVILVVLTAAASIFLVVYNLSLQLLPEQLEKARKLWQEKRPPDYTLTFTKVGSTSGTFVVTVRNGKVSSAVMKGEKIDDGRPTKVDVPLPERLWTRHDMGGLFQDLKEFLKQKEKPGGGRIFIHASFDPDDGHLRTYTCSNPATRERIQVFVQLKRD